MMTGTVQIIVAIVTMLAAVGTTVLGFMNRQVLDTVQKQTNGLMAIMRKDAEDKGRAEEKAEEMERNKGG